MVKWNNSASGIDGETNKYKPKSVRWVEIQRHDSGIRLLGMSTVDGRGLSLVQ